MALPEVAGFKIGDKVRNISDSGLANPNKGKTGEVWALDASYNIVYVKYDDGAAGSSREAEKDYQKLTTEQMKPTQMQSVLLDADTQNLLQAGFIGSDLSLTPDGFNALTALLFSANKAALVAQAAEIVAAKKSKKN